MAKEIYNEQETNNFNGTGGNKVGFFSLKNNGDYAIVRILHDSSADFDIASVHQHQVAPNQWRTLTECLRTNDDKDFSKCPLCEINSKNYPRREKIFIHMLEYVRDPQTGNFEIDPQTGKIKTVAKIWERPKNEYGAKLVNKISTYGPLSNQICRVTRIGAAGYTKTTYEIEVLPISQTDLAMYPKATELFDGFEVSGTMVPNKTKDEVKEFLATGKFPEKAMPNIGTIPSDTLPAGFSDGTVVAQQTPAAPVFPQNAAATAVNTNGGIPGVTLQQPAQNPYANANINRY